MILNNIAKENDNDCSTEYLMSGGIKLSFGNMTLALAVSFALGIIISLVYIKTH